MMSRIIEVKFHVGTTYNGSDVRETVEIEIEDGMTKEQVEETINEEFQTWVWENINADWVIKK